MKALLALVLLAVATEANATTVSFSVSPAVIDAGQSVALVWSSTGARRCSGIGFATSGQTRGSVTVTPNVTTTYTITCK